MEKQNEVYKKEIDLEDHPSPISLEQMKYIFKQMEKSIYKIKCSKGVGTGFLCLIPFPTKLNKLPTLITSNHVLPENNIAANQKIEYSFNDDKEFNSIIIDEDRKKYTNENYDITIIEIKPEEDKIDLNSFLEIDDGIYEENINEKYKQKTIYILHYPQSGTIKISYGVIKFINEKNFNIGHLCITYGGSSGGPLINLNNYKVIGVHKGGIVENKINVGTLINAPIKDFYNNTKNIKKEKEEIKMKKIENEKLNTLIEIKEEINEITIIYANNEKQFKKSEDYSKINFIKKINEKISKDKIFGEKFVENNKNKCKMIINGKEEELCSFYKRENNNNDIFTIKLKGIKNINDISYMFCGCESLLSLPDINNWNISHIKDMSYLFYQCSSLINIGEISKWNINNITDMNFLFYGCSSLSNLPDISKWNTNNVTYMGYMFDDAILI